MIQFGNDTKGRDREPGNVSRGCMAGVKWPSTRRYPILLLPSRFEILRISFKRDLFLDHSCCNDPCVYDRHFLNFIYSALAEGLERKKKLRIKLF